ncbi:MAG: UvrD-helicase domain-containing protein [Bacteroidetes bacterium]|nr:UvrD-helicase domain-containing protein [Bacteroidota bacterium]
MLSKLVQGVEAPFIYDRLGYKYRHFLLDEFQDTSRMQWLNIVPLIHEFIASNHLCFIVGDPKQSIYRFKNGLAEQFVALPAIYNPENDPNLALKSQYFSLMGEKKPILQNWRSSSNIVDFNNRFFEELKGHLPTDSAAFYDSHWQEAVSKKEGFVAIDFKEEKDFKEEQGIEWILQKVQECITDGFSPGDITILGNKNLECLFWAKALTQHGYSVVSADSLLVDSDQMVQLLVAYFHLRLRSNSDIAQKEMIAQFVDVQMLALSVYQKYVVREERYKHVKFDLFIEDYFSDQSAFYFSYENLYELGQKACDLLNIEPLKNHYVHHFLDLLFEFDKANGPDLLQFLSHFKEDGHKSAVQIPESSETIQVMTFHKSKGLEFEVVLMPNITIRKPTANNTDWFQIDNEVLELNINARDPIDEAVDLLNHEKSQILMDGVNLLYVGFTRPVERLYGHIILNTDSKFIQQCIENAFPKEFANKNLLEIGVREKKISQSKNVKSLDLFTPKSLKDFIWFPKIALKDSNHLMNDSTISEAAAFGTQFHFLLSLIKSEEEIGEKVTQLIAEGKIDARFQDEIVKQSRSVLKDVLEPIYRGSTKIISERSLLVPNYESTLRPDKIIFHGDKATLLDFKTGEPKKKDEKQILEYASLVRQMGYTVKAGLIYTEKNQVQWVETGNTLF